MEPSLCLVRLLVVRDERMISHAACRNAYTNTFSSESKRGWGGCKQVTEIAADQCLQTIFANRQQMDADVLQAKHKNIYVCLYLKFLGNRIFFFPLFSYCTFLGYPSLK